MNNKINNKNKEKKEIEKIDDKTIQDLIKKEFIDSCEKIIIKNQIKFIEDFINKIILIIKYYYGDDIFKKIKTLGQILY